MFEIFVFHEGGRIVFEYVFLPLWWAIVAEWGRAVWTHRHELHHGVIHHSKVVARVVKCRILKNGKEKPECTEQG